MKLTKYSDYALRVLIYMGLHTDRLCTIKELAKAYDISENHLMKLIHQLGKLNYIETVRGKNGGIRLLKNPQEVNIGKLIRETENNFHLVPCFDKNTSAKCPIVGTCVLTGIIDEALESFLSVLDKYSLEDLLAPQKNLNKRFVAFG